MASPPATEPVKQTLSTLPEEMTAAVWSWDSTMCWNTAFGRPAWSKAFWKRSATSSVWSECFSTTALPAISAGITELTVVR
ncbi:hypothetical protein A6302_03047 [Methylobrevis pamukkalensis]|uniref:Uncharacterized protein n=1 Tax=Methylobrevis pamukkalensis TaxID=1439726 RepID=A0A1E3GZZ3_9HYPH|nr:hypothetical protein A6302_03047 [Methylobrevis pamukkalensis]